MWRLIKYLALSLFLLFVLILGLEVHSKNHQLVILDYYVGTIEGPLSFLLAGTLVVGVCLGYAADWGMRRRLRRKIRILKRSAEGPAAKGSATTA